MFYEFDCGCRIPQFGTELKECDGLPPLEIDYYNINYNCPKTWALLGTGQTQGVFQLEKSLGKGWSKKLEPHNMEELAALTAILRPGVLKAKLDDKSLTQHFIDRKHGREEINYIHETLEPILEETYNILVYQEEAIFIATEIAGFDLQQADILRKAIGKKKPEIMAQVEKEFMEGCKNTGIVSEDIAKQIFSWIRESQKYSFNKCISGKEKLWGHKKNIKNMCLDNERGYTLSLYGFEPITNDIVNIIPNGRKPIYRITLNNGAYIDTTSNHKFPTVDGVKRLDEITIGDSLYHYKEDDRDVVFALLIDKIEFIGFDEVFDVEMGAPHHTFLNDRGIVTCNSHSVGYGMISYWTAYAKAHFPLHFFASYLHWSREKQDPQEERRQLVADAKLFNVEVYPPSITNLFSGDDGEVSITKKGIHFGIGEIKRIGKNHVKKFLQKVKSYEAKLGEISKWGWYTFLTEFSHELTSTVVNGLISVGALSVYGLPRQKMLFEYNTWKDLSGREQKWLRENHSTDLLKDLSRYVLVERKDGGPANINRKAIIKDLVKSLKNPPYDLKDEPSWIVEQEQNLLGIGLTYNKVDVLQSNIVNTSTCKDFLSGIKGKIILSVEIMDVRTYTMDDGKVQGYLCAEDSSGRLDNIKAYPDKWEDYKELLQKGSLVALHGYRDKRDMFIIEKAVAL